MRIHILGIAGTFMSGIAIIARDLDNVVSGQDANIYPPISEQLIRQNINFSADYSLKNLPVADLYIIGNALSRGNECVEYILTNRLNYTSGAKWLGENVLKHKKVIAISGTHGKTTTAAITTHIFIDNGLNPGFLIGGISDDLAVSARITDSAFFIIEADEYDNAFFDKRSKFIHYYPDILAINNIEFDHADIFHSIDDIFKEFHNLVRTMPADATIVFPNDANIKKLIAMGCYSRTIKFDVPKYSVNQGILSFLLDNIKIKSTLIGKHNVCNIITAITLAKQSGIDFKKSIAAIESFSGVRKRMEIKYKSAELTIYDDFAHHPTSIRLTINALREKVGEEHLAVALEFRSNTMKSGFFDKQIAHSLQNADEVLTLKHLIKGKNISVYNNVDDMIARLIKIKGHLVVMSNGNFDDITTKLTAAL